MVITTRIGAAEIHYDGSTMAWAELRCISGQSLAGLKDSMQLDIVNAEAYEFAVGGEHGPVLPLPSRLLFLLECTLMASEPCIHTHRQTGR